jgi:hypothetical protein
LLLIGLSHKCPVSERAKLHWRQKDKKKKEYAVRAKEKEKKKEKKRICSLQPA